jgi:hypothetical protein
VLIVLVVLAGLVAPAGAVAAEVPSSAYAQSLSTEPDFLEHPSLVFLHPARGVLEGRRIFVLDTYVGPGAAGGVWTLGRSRILLLSPRGSVQAQGTPGRVPLEVLAAGSTSALRAGWAVPLGGLRAGISASGEVWKDSDTRETLVLESESRYAYEYLVSETNWRAWTALAGIGVGSGRRAFDLTWETRWEKRDDVYIRARQTNTAVDTLIVSFEGDERPIPGAHLRVRSPLGAKTDLVLVGDWFGHEERRPGRLRGTIFGFDVDSSRVETGYRDGWRVGLAASQRIEPVDFVLLSVAYRHDRGPFYTVGSSGPRRQYATARSLALGASAREPLRQDLALHLGVRRSYRLYKSTDESGSVGTSSGRYEVDTSRTDQMSQEFDWGLDWTWRNLRLTGALSSTLALERPFLTLDASLAL